ncbi:ABC transporter substrate-binding protein [Cuneatibacter caecimuris]|uniref:Raffinose/stachyose/melibiose transport system substrate-binding protein n=1 Tax=Cuneatibacter caecimuris TaxID=1796618 RepID=A0A4V2F7P8_9FIRM|nr:extracellular solute-binding protein [Cuneatibacter caecimuris]RZT00570.1 raffinose/stachyose/melibiose transport system substrate-binding protein [Cuneatibacter caecimuris]
MKRRFYCAVMAGVMAAAMTGCGNTDSSKTTVAAGTENANVKGGELSILAPQNSVNDGTYAMVDAFEKKYGVKVSLELLPDNEAENLIRSRAATGDLGDIVDFHSGSQLSTLSPGDNLMDITGEGYLKNVDDTFLDCVTVDGKVYGTPVGPTYAGGVFYNKKIYEELKLEVPKTWEEFLENCSACQNAGYTGIIGTYGDAWTSQLLLLSDFYYLNSSEPDFAEKYTAGEVTLEDAPEYLKSLEKLAAQKEYFNADFLSSTNDDGCRMLVEGKGAHQIMRTREYNSMVESYPEAEELIGFFAVPGEDGSDSGITVWMPHGFYIAKNAKNLENAKLWQEFTTTEEAAKAYAAASSPMGPFMLKGVDLGNNVRPAIQEVMNYVEGRKSAPAMEFLCPVKGTNMAQICVQIGSGEISPEDGIKALHEDNKKSAQQLGLEGWK